MMIGSRSFVEEGGSGRSREYWGGVEIVRTRGYERVPRGIEYKLKERKSTIDGEDTESPTRGHTI